MARPPHTSTTRLPPLNALRAFDAAARHLNLAQAAAELRVTPAAVSHQIKALEGVLGLALFHRTPRGLRLTPAGGSLAPGLRQGFEQLAEAVAAATRAAARAADVLTVSVAPSFAAKWLVPRLERFERRHPGIDVRVAASMQLVNFREGGVDLAIRYGAGRWPGLQAELILRDTVYPVCSPALMAGPHPPDSPAALRHHTLLHDDSPDNDESCPDWAMWLRAAGAPEVDASRGPRFNQASLMLEAAMLGHGVGLAKSSLADADVAAGRLVRPFEASRPVRFAYYLVCPPPHAALPRVAAFRAWLLAEVAGTAEFTI